MTQPHLGPDCAQPLCPPGSDSANKGILQEKKTKPHISDNKSLGASTALLVKSNRTSSGDPGAGHRAPEFPWRFSWEQCPLNLSTTPFLSQ